MGSQERLAQTETCKIQWAIASLHSSMLLVQPSDLQQEHGWTH